MNEHPPSLQAADRHEHQMTQYFLNVLIADMPYHRECRCRQCNASFQRHSYEEIEDSDTCPNCFGTGDTS